MKQPKIQRLSSLEEEMRAVARGERPAPADASAPSFNSLEAVARLLTSENRQLLALIRDHHPESLSELAKLSGRTQPSLTRTLTKLEAAGFVTTKTVNRRKALTAAINKVVVEIDPFSDHDLFRVA